MLRKLLTCRLLLRLERHFGGNNFRICKYSGTSSTERPTPEIHCVKLFINNEWRESSNSLCFDVFDPTTETVLCRVQESSLEDLDLAVKAAKNAFRAIAPWRTMDASKRGYLLYKLADFVSRDAEYLARLETLNNGSTLADTTRDLKFAINLLRYYGGVSDKIHGKTIPADGDIMCITRSEPVGVCGLLLPWNSPLLNLSCLLGVSLACGNTLVIKPSHQTPLTTLYIAKLIQDAGFPPGVVNVVTGSGSVLGKAMSEHRDVDIISFTGSTQVGQAVQEAAARSNLKRTALHLSGKNPIVVFPDADLDKAVLYSHRAVFTNQGQMCSSGTRTFVHEDIYDEFIKKSKELIHEIVIGDPLLADTTQGPQINKDSMNYILKMIESGISEGATLECGGKRFGDKGCFVEPTLFSGVHDDMLIAREEIFGPVQQILKFKSLPEAIERSNNTRYGLVSAVFTSDLNTALAYAGGVRSGTVWVNTFLKQFAQTPCGGIKMSGYGKQAGFDSVYSYLQNKTVTIDIPRNSS